MRFSKLTRSIALAITMCMLIAYFPMTAVATGTNIGEQTITDTNTPPAAIEGAVWVLVDSVECKSIVHTHDDNCYYKSCDHNSGHLSTCYEEKFEYSLCEHDDDSQHTGTGDLTDVVSIDGTNVSWKTSHPAYPAIYAVYKTAYDEAYAKATFARETLAKVAGVAALAGKTFCYTASTSAEPTLCTHTCSEPGGSCYTKLCVLSEHQHSTECFQYTWELKSDANKNGIADDVDTYYTVKYMNGDEIILEKSILVDMPTPVPDANPSKEADAQYTYEFIGWDKPIANTVIEDTTYNAVYKQTLNKYTVEWHDEDGTLLDSKEVEYGAMPNYDKELPSKESTDTEVYTFAGWTPSVEAVSGNVVYTATYSTKSIHTVEFYINQKLEKTEYVVDGEYVVPYAPTREHFELSDWIADGNISINAPITGNTKFYATWTAIEGIVAMKGEHYTHDANEIYPMGANVVINIEPEEGYYIQNVLINGKEIADYNRATNIIEFTITQEMYETEIKVIAKKFALNLNSATMDKFGDLSSSAIFEAVYNAETSDEIFASDVKVEYLALSVEILDKTYDWWVEPGTDVNIEKFLNQYQLGSLAQYVPASLKPHIFGENDSENVRITLADHAYYPDTTKETTIAMRDMRVATSIVLNEGISVVYGATEDEILALIFNSVVADVAKTVVTENKANVSIKMDSLNAGTRTATVIYSGDATYAASVAEVEVVIEKASGSISIEDIISKQAQSVSLSDMIDANTNYIEIVMGLSLGQNASANAGAVVYINMPTLFDVNEIENETIRAIAEKIMKTFNDNVGGSMTIAELKGTLNKILPYIEQIENAGYTANISEYTITALIDALDGLSEYDDINAATIRLSINEEIVLSDAGAYSVVGIIADANYTTEMAAGYALILPDGYRAELDWNIHDENGIITIEALTNGYDLNASVVSVAQGNIADASKHLYSFFIGTNKDGEAIITQDASSLDFGVYTQIAFIADFGNEMYYAEPIIRTFAVVSDLVKVEFIDENGEINNDRIFAYGEDASMNAVAFDRHTGEQIAGGTISYYYFGIQADGNIYTGKTAPTKTGAYTVIAIFVGEDETTVGTAIGALAIDQQETPFNISNSEVEYDGNEHFVIVDNELGLKTIFVIVDEKNNVNIIFPAEINIGTVNVATIEKILDKIESISLPDEINQHRTEIIAKIKDAVANVDVNSVAVNSSYPTERGTYQIYAIAFGNLDYKVAFDEATLTITGCDHIYANNCDATCEICGEVRKIGGHAYVTINELAPSCINPGYILARCIICGDQIGYQSGGPNGLHSFESACDEDCNLCGYIRIASAHIYDNGCDIKCNVCGAIRNFAGHDYDNACDDTCNECDNIREVDGHCYVGSETIAPDCGTKGEKTYVCSECGDTYIEEVDATDAHNYDNDCDDTCSKCGFVREIEGHKYRLTGTTPPTCNKNGYDRYNCYKCGNGYSILILATGAHIYDNDCDDTCNKCHQTREVAGHNYIDNEKVAPSCGTTGEKEYTCSVCGDSYIETIEATGEHKFDNACDATCENCEHTREVAGHSYSNACDKDCDICGATREVPAHNYVGTETIAPECGTKGEKTYVCSECGDSYTEEVSATDAHNYDNDCDSTCSKCGFTREVADHIYDNNCDAKCNVCEAERQPADHIYDNACDMTCNVCEANREVEAHKYDDEYDANCNVCGAIREVAEKPCTHTYDNACDNICNICNATREVGPHTYDNEQDTDCNECGHIREVQTPVAPPTGDSATIYILMAVIAVSVLAIAICIRKRDN